MTDVEEREFVWRTSDFKRVQALIYDRAGISLHQGKQAMVYSRLARRLRVHGFRRFEDYLNWLDQHEGEEWQEFINALTTNLTSFFREAHHFDVLHRLLQSRPASSSWRAWCSAASTGEEPYSIGLTAMQALGTRHDFQLWASDIDSKVLQTAAKGVYPADALKDLDTATLERYFLRGKGNNLGLVKVRPELQNMVRFLSVNLIQDDWPFDDPFDVVFCRNVMIYFDGPTQREVLKRLHRVMKPGALLFAGHSENFNESKDLFVLKGKTVYERC